MREKFVILWAVCSLVACSSSAPKVNVCVSDPGSGGLQCAMKDGQDKFLDYKDSGNFVCLSPDDLDALVSWMKRQLDAWRPLQK